MDLNNIPEKYREDIKKASFLLKKEGSKAVFLFGSLVTGNFHDNSDIDMGIKGLPRDKFINLYSKLYFDFDNKIDLVDFDENDEFYSLLNNLGEVVQIG